jgi:hypothetical protein
VTNAHKKYVGVKVTTGVEPRRNDDRAIGASKPAASTVPYSYREVVTELPVPSSTTLSVPAVVSLVTVSRTVGVAVGTGEFVAGGRLGGGGGTRDVAVA